MKKLNYIIVSSAILLASCGGSKDREAQTDLQDSTGVLQKDTTAVTVDDTVLFKFDFAIANIPSPASLINGIKKMDRPYDKTILNGTAKVNEFQSEFSKAVNLGIYNIDMAYAISKDMGADVLTYLKTSMILSDGLGLKNTIANMVGKRAENNLSNQDSLFAMLDDIFTKSDEYLRTNQRVYVASLVFAGSWIEVLYLGAKVSDGAGVQAKEYMHKQIWEQRFHLGNIIKILQDYKGDKEYNLLIADLTEIHNSINKIKQASDISDLQFKEISGKIEVLRNRLSK